MPFSVIRLFSPCLFVVVSDTIQAADGHVLRGINKIIPVVSFSGQTMGENGERTYRNQAFAEGLVSFNVVVKETDIRVSSEKALESEARDLVFEGRHQIESYITENQGFKDSLIPWADDPFAPPLVREMIRVTTAAGVGPMASVAGAIAQYVGEGLLNFTGEIIVENGGDIFAKTNRPFTVSVLAGASHLSGKIGLRISSIRRPVGVCSSSGTVGHSLSLGYADIVCIVSSSSPLSDAVATAIGNRIRSRADLKNASRWADEIGNIDAGLVILGDKMSLWGDIELLAL